MDIGALLQSSIYLVSASLLYPCMVLLLGGFVVIVLSFGVFIADWAERSRRDENSGNPYAGYPFKGALDELDVILQRPDPTRAAVEKLWRDVRTRCWKRLDYLRILVRLGPAMGLVGTLIPMSTGLASLTQGDTSRLSSDLVIAFSTTVVGLCSGVAAYILYTVRARWIESDMSALELLIENRAAPVFENNEET
jgi:biopolymer transport protein ExbB/TolQ